MNLLLASQLKGVVQAAKPRFPMSLETARVLCIPTAANVYAPDKREWLDDEMNQVRAAGAKLDVYDIAGKNPMEVTRKLADADIVYVTGGNAYYLLEHMQRCNFSAALQPFFKRGGVYLGASAGAVVTCPRVDVIGEMDNPNLANLSSYKGLNLIPFLLMVHTDHPKYGPMAKALMHKVTAVENVIALTDTQALWVTNNAVELIHAHA